MARTSLLGKRRGSNAIEFALIMPVYVALMIGIVEFSWMFFVRSQVINTVRDSCRAGAVTPQDEAPEDVAESQMQAFLDGYTSCGGGCSASAIITGTSPEESLTCTLLVEYDFILMGGSIDLSASAVTLFELQEAAE